MQRQSMDMEHTHNSEPENEQEDSFENASVKLVESLQSIFIRSGYPPMEEHE